MALADETSIRALIESAGPRAAYEQLIAANNAQIRGPELDHGRAFAAARTAIHTALVADWAEEQRTKAGYEKPFAVVALGGTGRGEMAPCSDNDFAFLFDDALEGNPFLLELQRQVLHTTEFERRCGFACQALPFSLDDVPDLDGKQLNAFLDLQPVLDPHGLAPAFRERIRGTFDPFAHFLHVRGFWKDQWEKAAGEAERLDHFDIKNEGLRVFLAGIWTLAGKEFVHAHDIYRTLDDPRDLEAYEFLMRIRAFVHTRPKRHAAPAAPGNHAEDILTFDDFVSFGEMLPPDADDQSRFEFANTVRARLVSARRRVARFAIGVIERELRHGRAISPGSPIILGVGGLSHVTAALAQSSRDKSRAALQLLLAAQHYSVPVDRAELQTTFRHAGDWLEPVPELSALFYEPRGSLADTFGFLSQIDGAEARLFPGYARFESSLDERVMTERRFLRSALEREKLRALERFVRAGQEWLARTAREAGVDGADERLSIEAEVARLDADHLAAVKLALKTKRLPLTARDLAVRADQGRPLHERYATGLSNVPLADYYTRYSECGFTREMIRAVEFLIEHRRAFRDRVESGLNDAQQAAEFAALCGHEQRLRALFVFTCADRAEWESPETDPGRWFHIRELYTKAMARFRPSGADPTRFLQAAGYAADELRVLQDFGEDLFTGVYRQFATRFGSHLVRLAAEPDTPPKVSLVRDGTASIVVVAARDYRGLAATITGALWARKVDLRQAHLFSASDYGLALDFFHLTPREEPLEADFIRFMEEAIREHRFIGDEDEATLPAIQGSIALREWRPGQFCLRFETAQDAGGLVRALTYKVYRHLRGNIFALTAHAARHRAYVSVYHSLPADLPLEQAQALVTAFGAAGLVAAPP